MDKFEQRMDYEPDGSTSGFSLQQAPPAAEALRRIHSDGVDAIGSARVNGEAQFLLILWIGSATISGLTPNRPESVADQADSCLEEMSEDQRSTRNWPRIEQINAGKESDLSASSSINI